MELAAIDSTILQNYEFELTHIGKTPGENHMLLFSFEGNIIMGSKFGNPQCHSHHIKGSNIEYLSIFSA